MALDYKKIEFTLHESLVQLKNTFKLLGFDADLIEQINECEDLIKTKRYIVAVMGEFKRGKSSLINALLGSPILPADVTPTTATINRVTFAPEPKVIITYKDETTEEVGINELGEYVTKLTAEGESRALKIKEATIYYPTQICQNYVDIIDTPGLNDEERMTKITIDMLESVDAVIVPIHARSPFSATEKVFVCQMLESENISNIVFVITFMDQLDEEDYEYDNFISYVKTRIRDEVFEELEKRSADENIIKKAHTILDDMNLFTVSSSLALKSFITNNRTDLKKSGFDVFSTKLLHIVTAKQMENAVQKSVKSINALISAMAPQNEKRVDEIQSELRNLKESYDIVLAYDDNAKKTLSKIFADGYDRLNESGLSLFGQKNTAVPVFIKALSEIKINSHDAIKEALLNASSAAREMIHSNGLLPVIQLYVQHLTEDIKAFEEYLSTSLHPALMNLGISDIDNIVDKMLDNAKDTLGELTFKWTHPVIPSVTDLTNCNVIETAITAVDNSVNDCKDELYTVLTDIRKNWFSIVNENALKIKDIAENAYNIKNESLDKKLKAQEYNYGVKIDAAEIIIKNCDGLTERLRI